MSKFILTTKETKENIENKQFKSKKSEIQLAFSSFVKT